MARRIIYELHIMVGPHKFQLDLLNSVFLTFKGPKRPLMALSANPGGQMVAILHRVGDFFDKSKLDKFDF